LAGVSARGAAARTAAGLCVHYRLPWPANLPSTWGRSIGEGPGRPRRAGGCVRVFPAHVPRDILCGRGREAAGERRVCRLGGIGLVIAACYQRA